MNYDLGSIARLVAWVLVISSFAVGLLFVIVRAETPWKMALKILLTPALIWLEVSLIGHCVDGEPYMDAVTIAGTVAVCGFLLGIMWSNDLVEILINPLTNLFDGGHLPPESKPLYSTAISKRKSGRYIEAIAALREQLAKFPNDSEGTFLLATVQAEDLNDLPGAEITLNKFCRMSATAPKHIAAALNQLADWQLRLGQDVTAACATWQQIIDQFPGTDVAMLAENRIAHAAESEKHLLASHDRQAIRVPEGIQNLGLNKTASFPAPAELPATQRADTCVKHLAKYPHDAEVR